MQQIDDNHRLEITMIERLTQFTTQLIEIQELRSALISLKHNILTADLIPLKQMNDTIQHIKSYLQQNHIPLRLLRDSPTQIYNSKDFIYYRVDKQIFITVKFKLSPLQQPLTLYRIHALPMPVPNQPHSTLITGLPSYVAWNSIDSYYITYSAMPYLDSDNIYHIDSGLDILHYKHTTSCITALIADDITDIGTFCNTSLNPFQIQPAVYALGQAQLLLLNLKQYSIFCLNGTVKQMPGCTSCTIFLDCHCGFQSEFGYYLSRQIHCNDETEKASTASLGHLINLNILQAFFQKDEISRFAGNQLLKHPIEIKIPDMKVYQTAYTDNIATLDSQSLKLNHIANLSKQDSMVFQSLSHKLSYDLLSNDLEIESTGLSLFS